MNPYSLEICFNLKFYLGATCTPTFSAAKLRSMHLLMNRCVNRIVEHFDKLLEKDNNVINPKDTAVGFTIDVIGSNLFGTEININDESGKQSELFKNGLALFDLNPFRAMCFFGAPRWFNDLIGVHFAFSPKYFDYFANLTRTIVQERRKTNTKRNDLVQLLMDAYVYENDLHNTSFDSLTANIDKEGK